MREILWGEGEDWKKMGGGGQITLKGDNSLQSNLPLGDILLRGAGYFVTGPCSAAPPSDQSSYRYENILQTGEVLGHCIDAKISPKAVSEKAQTTVSENRYTFPKIDVFRTAILAPTGNNARASFSLSKYIMLYQPLKDLMQRHFNSKTNFWFKGSGAAGPLKMLLL